MSAEIYIEGRLVKEEPSPDTHRYIGMWRPSFDQAQKMNYPDTCGHSSTIKGVHHNWLSGHYDTPIYERVREGAYRVYTKESESDAWVSLSERGCSLFHALNNLKGELSARLMNGMGSVYEWDVESESWKEVVDETSCSS